MYTTVLKSYRVDVALKNQSVVQKVKLLAKSSCLIDSIVVWMLSILSGMMDSLLATIYKGLLHKIYDDQYILGIRKDQLASQSL